MTPRAWSGDKASHSTFSDVEPAVDTFTLGRTVGTVLTQTTQFSDSLLILHSVFLSYDYFPEPRFTKNLKIVLSSSHDRLQFISNVS